MKITGFWKVINTLAWWKCTSVLEEPASSIIRVVLMMEGSRLH
jgi:hypothetical protein